MYDVDINVPPELTVIRLAQAFHCLPEDIENMDKDWYDIARQVLYLDGRRAEEESRKKG